MNGKRCVWGVGLSSVGSAFCLRPKHEKTQPTKCASTTLTQIFMVRFCFRLRSHLSFAFHMIHGSDEDDCSWIMKCCNLQAGYQQNEKITDVWTRVETMGEVKWRLLAVDEYVWRVKEKFERFEDDLRRLTSLKLWKLSSFRTICWCGLRANQQE